MSALVCSLGAGLAMIILLCLSDQIRKAGDKKPETDRIARIAFRRMKGNKKARVGRPVAKRV